MIAPFAGAADAPVVAARTMAAAVKTPTVIVRIVVSPSTFLQGCFDCQFPHAWADSYKESEPFFLRQAFRIHVSHGISIARQIITDDFDFSSCPSFIIRSSVCYFLS
jgi:hypothetical protein